MAKVILKWRYIKPGTKKAFIGKVNTIIEEVDFEKLLESANGQDQSYAMETLKQLHQAFVDTYGTDCITDRELGFRVSIA